MATLAVLEQIVVDEIGSLNRTDDSAKLKRWANDAVRDVLLRTKVKVVSRTVALTVGSVDYTLDDEVLLIRAAYVSGEAPMERVSPDEMDWLRAASPSTSSPVRRYALDGNDLFMVYPSPASATTVNMRVVFKPTEMSADTHDPSNATYGGIPVEFHPVLADYMFWKAASHDDDGSSAQGTRYKEQYEEGLGRIRKVVSLKGGRLPRARVGKRRLTRDVPSRDS